MEKMVERTPVALRDAMIELSMGGSHPDPETLDALVKRLPEHAEALTEFALDLLILGLASEDEGFVVANDEALNAEASSALSVFQNALYRARHEGEVASASSAAHLVEVVENPFEKLNRAGIRAAADALGSSVIFVMKLRDRVIIASTLTNGFIARVADVLGRPFDLVAGHLRAGEAVALRGQSFKAEGKPVLGAQQTFEEALLSSELTPEQQERLRLL